MNDIGFNVSHALTMDLELAELDVPVFVCLSLEGRFGYSPFNPQWLCTKILHHLSRLCKR